VAERARDKLEDAMGIEALVDALVRRAEGAAYPPPRAAGFSPALPDDDAAINPSLASELKRDRTIEVLKANHDALNILVFLARCDGEYHASEDDVIAQFLHDRAFDVDFNADMAIRYARQINPDPECFCESVAALAAERPEELVTVAQFAKLLIEADGVIADEEEEFAVALADALNEAL